jgi:hypothetical protein
MTIRAQLMTIRATVNGNMLFDSSYDAAHLYLTHTHGNPGCWADDTDTSTALEVSRTNVFTMFLARAQGTPPPARAGVA